MVVSHAPSTSKKTEINGPANVGNNHKEVQVEMDESDAIIYIIKKIVFHFVHTSPTVYCRNLFLLLKYDNIQFFSLVKAFQFHKKFYFMLK